MHPLLSAQKLIPITISPNNAPPYMQSSIKMENALSLKENTYPYISNIPSTKLKFMLFFLQNRHPEKMAIEISCHCKKEKRNSEYLYTFAHINLNNLSVPIHLVYMGYLFQGQRQHQNQCIFLATLMFALLQY